jgi:hypothetical protein
MKKDKMVINITDTNSSKSEIVYENVVSNMEEMSLNKNDQIEYLKARISNLEKDQKLKYDLIILGLSALFALIIGVTFMILNFYVIGIFIIFTTCFVSCYHTFKLSSTQRKISLDKFEEIEEIRKIISSKLK